ncbi:hypothetical protein IU429_17200 [Nocardia elegans]|uniref:Uncharacterized protein n=1 Tax=Nocardia elegans TaxID=300029 RepID=A0ABW6T5D4_9NOCA|nr:hypothetical protein [Nocardia elegans]MBF6449410.1 hypothetical protein [Nocardia elegans]
MRLSNAAIGARRVKNVLKWIGAMVVGVVMIVGAVTMLNSHGKVDCGGETMRSGDQCVQVDKHGHRTTRSMDEQASDNTRTGWLLLGFGVLMIVGGGAFLVGELRRSGGSGAKTGMQVVANPAAYPPASPAYPATHANPPGAPAYPGVANGGHPPANPAAGHLAPGYPSGAGGYPAPGYAPAGTGYPPPSPGYPAHPGPSGHAEYPSAAPHFAPSGPAPSYPPGPPGYPPTAPDGARPGYPTR